MAGESLNSLRLAFGSWNRCVVYDGQGVVLFKDDSVLISKDELVQYVNIMDSREAAIKRGIILFGQVYELTRFHPPLVYGRRGDPTQFEGEGIAVCQFAKSSDSSLVYGLITYPFPSNAAKSVPELQKFCGRAALIL